MITSAKGINGQIEVYDNKVIIKRKGFIALATQGLKGNKEIYILNRFHQSNLKMQIY